MRKLILAVLLAAGLHAQTASLQLLIVAGGGSGGGNANGVAWGGGGGCGGILEGILTRGAGAYPVTVGGVGPGVAPGLRGNTGGDSSFDTTYIANGGGAGGGNNNNGQENGGSGGCGGGGGSVNSGGAGSNTQTSISPLTGHSFPGTGGTGGFASGAGGGAGGIGSGSTGGIGYTSSISGTSITYGVGGDGVSTLDGDTPGSGGGGRDRNPSALSAVGIVIVAYTTGSLCATGGTITTSGGNTIHTFTANGTWTLLNTGGCAGAWVQRRFIGMGR